ncbi:hypothetical protein [Aquicella lusitana]|uniref:Uncharacterized protein n=1 Tax=Aquicella lusitana TaxID=254246 RepID=A0A370GJ45_9COXI|nr:hypothetical protein [Aquicella lusitana]RDI43822.1 hypothetical protein C8D86_11092 [Aquicella lusitana]VVC74447.1 hypothetical protein AQULUS_22130 [Aquicella lusitana]
MSHARSGSVHIDQPEKELFQLQEIKQLCFQYVYNLNVDSKGNTNDLHEEVIIAFKLASLFNTQQNENAELTEIKYAIRHILAQHATYLVYHASHNSFYIKLLDFVKKGSNLNDEYLAILFPSLKWYEHDGRSISELKRHEFILTDDGTDFILLQPLFEQAFLRANHGIEPLYAYIDPLSEEERSLSPEEIKCVHQLIPQAKYFTKAAMERLNMPAINLSQALDKLIAALKKGDVEHDGSEEVAAKSAAYAVLEFDYLYKQLHVGIKIALRRMLEEIAIYDELPSLVKECVQGSQIKLKTVLNKHRDFLSAIMMGRGSLRKGNQTDWGGCKDDLIQQLKHPSEHFDASRITQLAGLVLGKLNEYYHKSKKPCQKLLRQLVLYICEYVVKQISEVAPANRLDEWRAYLNLLFSIQETCHNFDYLSVNEQKSRLAEISFRLAIVSIKTPTDIFFSAGKIHSSVFASKPTKTTLFNLHFVKFMDDNKKAFHSAGLKSEVILSDAGRIDKEHYKQCIAKDSRLFIPLDETILSLVPRSRTHRIPPSH